MIDRLMRLIILLLGGGGSGLDRVMFRWRDGTPYTVRNSLEHAQVFGRSGSGKTSASLKHLAMAMMKIPKSGGLVLSSKPSDREMWLGWAKKAGRELRIFGKDHPDRFNVIDYLGSDTRQLSRFVMSSNEVLGRLKSGKTDSYWQDEQYRNIFNAAEVIRIAYGKVNAPAIQQFILTAATHPDLINDAKWMEGFHHRTLTLAKQNAQRLVASARTEQEKVNAAIVMHDFELTSSYWALEYPPMNSKQRSGILGMVMTVLHTFNTGYVRELLSTTTTVSPQNLFDGEWLLIDADPETEEGRFMLNAWKHATQKGIMGRINPENPVYIIMDEAQNLVSSGDADALAKMRSFMGGQLMLTQGINSYYSVMGDHAEAFVKSMLTNCSLKIFHQAADKETAEFGAELLGKHKEVSIRVRQGDKFAPLRGEYDFQPDFSEEYQYVLNPRFFLDIARTGGPPHYTVDAIAISTRPFRDGQRYLSVSFKQR